MEELMQKIVDVLRTTYYGDVRFERSYGLSIMKNKSREKVTTTSSCGLCVRVISNNRWHYLGFDTIDEKKILDETKKLVRRVGNRKSRINIQEPWETDQEVKVRIDPQSVELEEKVNTIKDVFKELMSNKKIVNASVAMAHSSNETIFMNTEGSVLRQVLPFFKFLMTAVAKEGNRLEQDYYVLAKQGGYELFTSLDLQKEIKTTVNGAIDLLKAKVVRAGRQDIIVDPEIAGVIAHESFGHGLEADQVMRNRSYLSGLKGKKIVSELISIHDNGSLKGERGFFFFDDEGIKSSDTILVENGVLKQFMHDRQSSAFMNSLPTGNGRAQDFSRKVYVRMSNTYIQPGDWKRKELIEETKSGFYLMKAVIGMEDPLGGNLQILSHKAREIKNGELGTLYKGVGISGKVLKFLSNVDAVTDDFEIKGSSCGKGHEDSVFVSTGGPYMRVRNAIIG